MTICVVKKKNPQITSSLSVSCFLLTLLQSSRRNQWNNWWKCHHSWFCMLTNVLLHWKEEDCLSAWDFIEMDKNSCSLSALLLSHCTGVYSYWIEALLSAEALPVIGCLWQGSQLFRETGKAERGLSATPGSWDWLVLYQVVKFRAQMSPQGHGCLFDRPSQRKMSGPE